MVDKNSSTKKTRKVITSSNSDDVTSSKHPTTNDGQPESATTNSPKSISLILYIVIAVILALVIVLFCKNCNGSSSSNDTAIVVDSAMPIEAEVEEVPAKDDYLITPNGIGDIVLGETSLSDFGVSPSMREKMVDWTDEKEIIYTHHHPKYGMVTPLEAAVTKHYTDKFYDKSVTYYHDRFGIITVLLKDEQSLCVLEYDDNTVNGISFCSKKLHTKEGICPMMSLEQYLEKFKGTERDCPTVELYHLGMGHAKLNTLCNDYELF